jgi:hypothetical protein
VGPRRAAAADSDPTPALSISRRFIRGFLHGLHAL